MDDDPRSCPFCRKNNLLKGNVIYKTEHAYLMENSFQPGNYLLIPEIHTTVVGQLPDAWWAEVKELLRRVPGLGADYNISLNIGALAGQTQPHLHFWVIPRAHNSVGAGKGMLGLMELLKDRQHK